MRDICIFFNLVNLVFMNEALYVSAFFDEAGTKEIYLPRLQAD